MEEPEDGEPGDECEEGGDGEADGVREGGIAGADGVAEREEAPLLWFGGGWMVWAEECWVMAEMAEGSGWGEEAVGQALR